MFLARAFNSHFYIKIVLMADDLQRHEAAYTLYKEGFSQKHIAKILKVSEQSINRWKGVYSWDVRKISQTSQLLKSEEDLITAISHQTRVISLIARRQQFEMEQNNINDLTVAELKQFLLDAKDLDGYSKLASKLDKKAPGWEEIVRIMRKWMGWLKDYDINLAQQIAEVVDTFINESRG